MAKEDTLHIKFDYNEALQAKKDLLSSQVALLRIAKTLKDYKSDRSYESEIKISLNRKLKDLKVLFGRLQKTLPQPEIPSILKRDEVKTTESKSQRKTSYNATVEDQLKEIEERLHKLQKKS